MRTKIRILLRKVENHKAEFSKGRKTCKAKKLIRPKRYYVENFFCRYLGYLSARKEPFALYFWKAEIKLHFKPFSLFSFYENSTFIFYIRLYFSTLSFWPFMQARKIVNSLKFYDILLWTNLLQPSQMFFPVTALLLWLRTFKFWPSVPR